MKFYDKFEFMAEAEKFFDWDKTQKVMTYLGWTWAPVGGVPSIPDMKAVAFRLISSAWDQAEAGEKGVSHIASTGGFEACCAKDEYGMYAEIKFVLSSWCT